MHYRLYYMSATTGHIEGVEHIDAQNDAQAVNEMCGFLGDRPVELWCDTRKVSRLEARDLTAVMLERRRWARALAEAEEEKRTANASGGLNVTEN